MKLNVSVREMKNKHKESFVLFKVNKTYDLIEKQSLRQLKLFMPFVILARTHTQTYKHMLTFIIIYYNHNNKYYMFTNTY